MITGITVIIPTFNRVKILPTAINSIIGQIFKDWKLLIIDNCSDENTADLVNSFSVHDKRIKYYKQGKKSGPNAALNLGLSLARYEIISYLESDDEMHPMNLQVQFEKFSSEKDLALCYVGVDYYFRNKKISTVHPEVRGEPENFLFTNLKGLGASNSGFAALTYVIREIGGFNISLPSQQDLDLFVRDARNHIIDFIKDCNTKVYLNSGNRISDNLNSLINGEVQFINKHELRIRELGLYHYVARKLACKSALYGNGLKKTYSMLIKAIRSRPSYFYAYLYAIKLPNLYFKR